jgi:hypothetical protein
MTMTMRARQLVGLVAGVMAMAIATGAAQTPEVKLPLSPRGSAAAHVAGKWVDGKYTGGRWITVDYGRPILRGRADIFGAGAAYGKTVNPDSDVWRAGANDTTRLTTQATLVIGGTTLTPGTYNVFVDLKEKAWMLVLSNQGVQPKYDPNDKVLLYGAYNYNPKFDVLRAPMRLSTSPMSIEQFTIGFADVRPDRGTLYMTWDRTVAAIDFTVK